MKREIRCSECKLYLGEIRNASLRKGIVYQCADCSEKMNWILKQMDPAESENEIFKNMFQGTWK